MMAYCLLVVLTAAKLAIFFLVKGGFVIVLHQVYIPATIRKKAASN